MGKVLKVTILGCGSSGGIPRADGEWGICNPDQPRNRRSRCSILLEQWQGHSANEPENDQKTIILIDTSPDLRQQLIHAKIKHLDAIVYTHEHADQSHGIDDVRAISYRSRRQIPVYMDDSTKQHLFTRFRYCFEMPEGRVHPPILELKPVFQDGDSLRINGPGGIVTLMAINISHGPSRANGFRINNRLAYMPDVWQIDDAALARLKDLDLWIVDALRYNEHPTHAHLDRTMTWIARTQTRKAILTNLHIDMDYDVLSSEMIGQHCVAYDGMTEFLLD